MNEIIDFLKLLLDSKDIIRVGGLLLITIIVYAETGIFFCFFLPGDYLLFLAGVSVAVHILPVSIELLVFSIFAAAVLGNYTAYIFGRTVGSKLSQKKDSLFFKKKYLDNTREFFDKYGGKALIIARFLPIVRTFAPIMAGTANMDWKRFSLFNFAGGALWVFTLTLSGYYLGVKFPQIMNYVEYIILGFIGFTTFSVVRSYFKIVKSKIKPH